LARAHDHAVARVEECLRPHGPVVEILDPVGRGLKEALLAVLDGIVGLHAMGDQIIAQPIEHLTDLAPLEGAEGGADDLHVLLRHRPQYLAGKYTVLADAPHCEEVPPALKEKDAPAPFHLQFIPDKGLETSPGSCRIIAGRKPEPTEIGGAKCAC
jgi:hypothetical protein